MLYELMPRRENRVIVVEGPDGAGKTTLVDAIAKKYGLTVGERLRDRTRLHETTVADTFRALSQAVACDHPRPVIWDRLFYSDLVYAPVVRKEPSRFNKAQSRLIRHVLNALDCPFILCLPPLPIVRQNVELDPRSQMSGVLENIIDIYEGYLRLAETGMLPQNYIIYDYTTELDEHLWYFIRGYLGIKEARCQ